MSKRVSLAEAAKALGKSSKTLGRWRGLGMPVHENGPGRPVTVNIADVKEWLARTGRDDGGPAPVPAPGPPSPPPPPGATLAAAPSPSPSGGAARLDAAATPSAETPSAELGLGVSSRRRSWRAAALALRSVETRLEANRLEPSPQHAESLARTARMLTEAVRGDGTATVELSPREMLTRALSTWLRQWGEDGLAVLLADARALVREAPRA